MAEDEGYDEVSDQEKLQIAQHFLLSSPPGQFPDVLSDVRKLVGDALLPDPLAAGIARVHNCKTAEHAVDASGDNRVIICEVGEVDPTHYIDPKRGTVVAVDHIGLSLVEGDSRPVGAGELDESLSGAQAAVQEAMDGYIQNSFVSETSAAAVYGKGDNTLTVIVSGKKLNLRNYWSGRWVSTWTVRMRGSNATIEGEIKLLAHYLEDGNVQLHTAKKPESGSVRFSNDRELAQGVYDHILQAEAALQSGLEDMYTNMSEETFRQIRRVMPLTGTMFEWNLTAHRLARGMRK